MTIAANGLYTADFTYDKPFQLTLTNGEIFYAEKIVRVIPKRRIVAFGIWQNKPTVAKVFIDSRRAKRHMEKELAGLKSLQENKIPTPALIYTGTNADERSQVLLFERIEDAKNLEEIWRERIHIKEFMPELRAVMIELATQHVLGVMQHDLHLKNFLLTEKTVYTLDGAQIEVFTEMLAKKPSMNNMALFLSQLGTGVEKYQIELFRYYAKARGWVVKSKDVLELFKMIKVWNDERWQRYVKKIFRDSTDFVSTRRFGAVGMYHRQYSGREFIGLMRDPESAFRHPSMEVLKNGRSATVVKVTLDQRDYVIKRYNMKNIFHYLRRCLRATRAVFSWRLSQKLKLFHIATASPVAFIEKRFFRLRGKSYFVMEYVSGKQADNFFAENIKTVTALLKNLAKLGITHGDLKITNILSDSHNQPLLIDLDGAIEHDSLSGLRKAWRKEIKRFLKNFDNQPQLREQYKKELG